MSSGACRALVALLLTLVATSVMALPVAAKEDALVERSTVTYTIHPASGEIEVDTIFVLKTRQSPFPPSEWGPIVVEERARPRVTTGFSLVPGATSLPGLWKAVEVKTPRIDGGSQAEKFVLSYTLDASITQNDTNKERTPARVDGSYMFFCVPGQDTDTGSVRIKVDRANRWKMTQTGTQLKKTNSGFELLGSKTPAQVLTCVEGVREGELATDTFIGPAGRQIILQAWEDEPNWLVAAEPNSNRTLDAIHRFLGHDIPGEGPVIIRMAPPRTLGGYASAHDTPGIVQLDERGGTEDPEHQLAHAWFGTDNFQEQWLREGMALWTTSAMAGRVCAPASDNAAELDLRDWQVVKPTSGSDIDRVIADQDAAACGIVSAVAARMPEEQWRVVLGSMLDGETKYVGTKGPELASTPTVDYREWLDAVDERGLVPAGADPAFADNMTDLDFAQDLLDSFGVPTSGPELSERSEARAYYHRFLADAAPMGAPLAVRKAMDDWRFGAATSALDKSYEVLTAIQEADAALPTAGLIPLIQNRFENAANVDAIEAVRVEAFELLERASELVTPLGELQAASPVDWDFPAAIETAIDERRFDDARTAIAPAMAVVQEVTAADRALPMAGLLDLYRLRYETTATAGKLEDLATNAANVRRQAEATGRDLALLESEVGEWQIPAAVTDPIDRGQITSGRAIIGDARAVVTAATAADIALPEAQLRTEFREEFEDVETAGEMAVLRTKVEIRRDEAQAVGDARSALSAMVPGWQLPVVVTEPVEDGDLATAAIGAAAAEKWIENAWRTDQALPEFGALTRIKDDFENAESLAELQAGAALAEQWAEAADHVGRAIAANAEERDLLTDFGLWGVDVETPLQEALDAALAGRVDVAINKSAEVQSLISGGSSSGSLRMAGLVFFGVAVLGVLGLWVMLRRQSGPSWARSSKPHWLESGRGKKDDK